MNYFICSFVPSLQLSISRYGCLCCASDIFLNWTTESICKIGSYNENERQKKHEKTFHNYWSNEMIDDLTSSDSPWQSFVSIKMEWFLVVMSGDELWQDFAIIGFDSSSFTHFSYSDFAFLSSMTVQLLRTWRRRPSWDSSKAAITPTWTRNSIICTP